jgi:protein-tyrosine phosphatase
MEQHLLHPDRHIAVERAFNIRDIGGYPTRDGQVTQWKRFLRADGLHALHDADRQVLLDYGVRLVVDLRLPIELKSAPNVFSHSELVQYRHLPLVDEAALKRIEQVPVQEGTHVRVNKGYRSWLDLCQPLVRNILVSLLDNETGAVLYHCTAGKDRTGLVTALLLGLAGVPDLIAADYALTSRYNIRSTFRAPDPEIHDWRDYEAVYCPPAVMHESLEHLNQNYGGATGYIREIGVTEDQVGRLRSLLLG